MTTVDLLVFYQLLFLQKPFHFKTIHFLSFIGQLCQSITLRMINADNITYCYWRINCRVFKKRNLPS